MPFTGPKLTNFGLSVLLKTQQGKQLHFTRIALGDGEIGSGSMLTRKTLIAEKLSVLIDAVRLSDTSASIVAQVSNDTLTEGFYFREKGVYCQDPDTQEEGLFVYDNCREEGEYINDKDSAHKVSFYIRERLTFSQTPQITFDASGNPIYVLYDDFNAQNSANDTRFTTLEESISGHETDITQLQDGLNDAETALASKADKATGATAGHIAVLDADGNVQDGGASIEDAGGTAIYISKSLSTGNWTKVSGNIWSQTISDANIKSGMRIDLAATPATQQTIYSDGFSLTAYSDTDGIAIIQACGTTKPSVGMAIQIILQKASGPLNRYGNSLGVPPVKYANKVEVVYLSPSGNDDTGDGSLSKPYKSISKIRDIVNGLRPNYEYIRFELRGGTYEVGGNLEFYLPANLEVRIQPYNSETVIINNASLRFYYGNVSISSIEIKAWSDALRIGSGYLKISHCKMSPYSPDDTSHAIGVDSSRAEIANTQFDNCKSACVNCWETSIVHCNNNTGSGNSIAHRCQGGIIIRTGTYPSASTNDQKIDGGQIFIG